MRIEYGSMVALGYGKYFKSDSIVGLEPIDEDRGPGRRTWVFIEGQPEPFVASRSEGAILRDMVTSPDEITRAREQQLMLSDILDKISGINLMLRTILREQGNWDLDILEERIEELLSSDGG